MRTRVFCVISAAIGLAVTGCSDSEPGSSTAGVGGAPAGGSTVGTGGVTAATGGKSQTGGTSTVGGASVTGVGGSSTGGTANTGGVRATGGTTVATGGTKASGGSTATGGVNSTGGTLGSGGISTSGGSSAVGGKASTGGALATGGTSPAGGTPAMGGNRTTGGGVTTGGTNATGGAANVGGGSFNPCPTNGDPCKILPLGDSITWGIGYEGAYRVQLFTKAVAAQQKITFTGSLSNGPTTVSNTTIPRRNEGHSGWTIAQDTALVPSPSMDTANGGMPHIVLVHLGTNDLASSTAQAMATRLGTLIDKVVAAAPNALVVVAKIVPISMASSNTTATAFNNLIPGLVDAAVAKGNHVIMVDLNTGFTTSMLGDGVHPTQAGYNWMGDRFYAAISSVLPK